MAVFSPLGASARPVQTGAAGTLPGAGAPGPARPARGPGPGTRPLGPSRIAPSDPTPDPIDNDLDNRGWEGVMGLGTRPVPRSVPQMIPNIDEFPDQYPGRFTNGE